MMWGCIHPKRLNLSINRTSLWKTLALPWTEAACTNLSSQIDFRVSVTYLRAFVSQNPTITNYCNRLHCCSDLKIKWAQPTKVLLGVHFPSSAEALSRDGLPFPWNGAVSGLFSGGALGVTQLRNEKRTWLFRVYYIIGDYTTQFYGIMINHYKDPC